MRWLLDTWNQTAVADPSVSRRMREVSTPSQTTLDRTHSTQTATQSNSDSAEQKAKKQRARRCMAQFILCRRHAYISTASAEERRATDAASGVYAEASGVYAAAIGRWLP